MYPQPDEEQDEEHEEHEEHRCVASGCGRSKVVPVIELISSLGTLLVARRGLRYTERSNAIIKTC